MSRQYTLAVHVMGHTDFSDLVPELSRWDNGKGIDIDGWICCVGNFEHAIGYGRLLWPMFKEHEGCIFWADFSVESYRGFMEHTGSNKKAVEAVMNHRHIVTLFGDPSLNPTREQVIYLGRLLRDIWKTKLERDYPTKKIVVSFPEEDRSDLLDYEITFFQEWATQAG